jgi:hypothetical protein
MNNNLNTLIPVSLEYYDNNNQEYLEFKKKIVKTETINNDKDMEKSKIIFYDKNNKKLLESEYEIAGIFYKKYNTWIWGWALPNINKNLIMISRKLLNYALDIDLKQSDQFKFIKTELITSRSKITSQLQLDIYLSLISYLSKKKFIYKRRFFLNNEENDNYIDYYFFIMNESI